MLRVATEVSMGHGVNILPIHQATENDKVQIQLDRRGHAPTTAAVWTATNGTNTGAGITLPHKADVPESVSAVAVGQLLPLERLSIRVALRNL